MNEIRIFQIKNVHETKYAFMDYDYAQDKINMEDYTMVAEFDDEDTGSDIDILNKMWEVGNNGTLQQTFRMRSISMSDIIEINGKIDYIVSICDRLGLQFDNTVPNRYTVISSTGRYQFGTYGDVIEALELLWREKDNGR